MTADSDFPPSGNYVKAQSEGGASQGDVFSLQLKLCLLFELLSWLQMVSPVLATCKMPPSAHETSITTVAAALSYITPMGSEKAKKWNMEAKGRNSSRAVPSKAGAVCSETALPVSSRDPGSSSLIPSSPLNIISYYCQEIKAMYTMIWSYSIKRLCVHIFVYGCTKA